MAEVVIFGGTCEGRRLAEFCASNQIHAAVTVVSDYGNHLIPQSKYLHSYTGALGEKDIDFLLNQEKPELVIDATHPYAAVVTGIVKGVCKGLGIPYIRVVRSQEYNQESPDSDTYFVPSVSAAVDYLLTAEGNILVTTGSKELQRFTGLPDYQNRVYARVLPSAAVLSALEDYGIRGKQVIAMQGPFSRDMNLALIRQTKARYLVTKEAGSAGGFTEKMEAAREAGVTVIVVGRPFAETGESVEQVEKRLLQYRNPGVTSVHLIGIGMGGEGQFTLEAVSRLKKSQVVFGAPRMLDSVKDYIRQAQAVPEYLSGNIIKWLEEHTRLHRVSVVFSGDPGFYSGAKQLVLALREEEWKDKVEVSITPGISSVSYLCAKSLKGWEDVRLVSSHGREWDILQELSTHDRVFALLDGSHTVERLCSSLDREGYENVLVTVGEQLSYPEERIREGKPGQLKSEQFNPLSVILIEKKKEQDL